LQDENPLIPILFLPIFLLIILQSQLEWIDIKN